MAQRLICDQYAPTSVVCGGLTRLSLSSVYSFDRSKRARSRSKFALRRRSSDPPIANPLTHHLSTYTYKHKHKNTKRLVTHDWGGLCNLERGGLEIYKGPQKITFTRSQPNLHPTRSVEISQSAPRYPISPGRPPPYLRTNTPGVGRTSGRDSST